MPLEHIHLIHSPKGGSPDALILVDVINDLAFPGGKDLLRWALPAARKIAALAQRARLAKIPVIYVNDNFGQWRSDFRLQVQHCLKEGCRGRPIVQLLQPEESDYFVLKPMHSGFYCTTLEILLDRLGTKRVILAGFAADICVLYTANDAYMRGFELIVPRDCVASETTEGVRFVVQHMCRRLKAKTPAGSRVVFRSRRR